MALRVIAWGWNWPELGGAKGEPLSKLLQDTGVGLDRRLILGGQYLLLVGINPGSGPLVGERFGRDLDFVHRCSLL